MPLGRQGKILFLRAKYATEFFAAVWLFVAVPAAAENYQTDLGPAPLDGTNRQNVLGRGSVVAVLNGSSFTVSGSFSGLSSPATAAHLNMGMVMGGTGPA